MVDCGGGDCVAVLATENKVRSFAAGFAVASWSVFKRLGFQRLAFVCYPPGIFFSQIADSSFTGCVAVVGSGNLA